MVKRIVILMLAVAALLCGCLSDATVDRIQRDNDISVRATTQPLTKGIVALLPPPFSTYASIAIGLWPGVEKLIVNPLWDLFRQSTTRPTTSALK